MSSKQRNYRRRNDSDEQDDEQSNDIDIQEKLEELKEMQKFRIRPKGVSASGLAFGAKVDATEDVGHDPFKLKTGGILDLNTVKDRDRDRSGEGSDKDVTSLGSNFSQETNRRDEDVEMLKFIEDEISRRKGIDKKESKQVEKPKTKEDLLYQLPDNINVSSKVMKSEEMLSNQMLSGIPEKASDVEKQKEKNKLEEQQLGAERSKGPVVQAEVHIPEPSSSKNSGKTEQGKRKNKDEASDDYLYEKFKKKTRDSWRYQ
eukprot:Seg4468.3 transcript_id=Seg4468.3/GoldUCD/mRNA.D3Y31 product="Telomere length and silencing protein 1-like" protein_id=Seg4468.3/GoldUCD/D3Y31